MSPSYKYSYPVEIKHLYISPGHNYFTQIPGQPGSHSTEDAERVEAVVGMGLIGDRFYGYQQHYEGQVTFFGWEVFNDIVKTLNLNGKTPAALRRNMVLSGAPVTELIGHEFAIGEAVFRGTKHCAPCSWMDHSLGAGALKLLRGRGGLRARVLQSGSLGKGPAVLRTGIELQTNRCAAPLPALNLP